MFWCIAPFLVASIVILPIAVRPPAPTGWLVLVAYLLLCIALFFGLWDAKRFWWCWRAVGGIIALSYLAYLIAMVVEGQWFGDGRRSSATAINALVGFFVFGYPGFMYAVFGRFTWKPDPEYEDDWEAYAESEEIDAEAGG